MDMGPFLCRCGCLFWIIFLLMGSNHDPIITSWREQADFHFQISLYFTESIMRCILTRLSGTGEEKEPTRQVLHLHLILGAFSYNHPSSYAEPILHACCPKALFSVSSNHSISNMPSRTFHNSLLPWRRCLIVDLVTTASVNIYLRSLEKCVSGCPK